MRITDKIANKIIEELEDHPSVRLTIAKASYLNVECLIADLIATEISHWLKWDVDLNEPTDTEIDDLACEIEDLRFKPEKASDVAYRTKKLIHNCLKDDIENLNR